MTAPVHVRKYGLRQCDSRLAVQIDHLAALVNRYVAVAADLSEAGAVDEHLDVGPVLFQQGGKQGKGLAVRQVIGERAESGFYLALESGETLLSSGNDPYFIIASGSVELLYIFCAESAGSAGYNCNIHRKNLRSRK